MGTTSEHAPSPHRRAAIRASCPTRTGCSTRTSSARCDGTERCGSELADNRQSIGVIIGAYESAPDRTAGEAVTVLTGRGSPPTPSRTGAARARRRGGVRGGVPDFQEIGFTAVKADVPDDMTASEYAEWIAGYGLAPALSLFNSPFDETIDMARRDGAGQAVRRDPGGARAGPHDGLLDGGAGADGRTGGRRRLRRGPAGARHRQLRHRLPGAAGRRAAAAAPLARRRRLRDRGRDRPAARRPRARA